MVSSPHEAMHRIFQQDPGLFARAARHLGVAFEEPIESTQLPTDLSENRPVERRVDTLLRLDTATSGSYLLAVEAQGRKDPAKPASWTYYLAHLYAKYGIPPVLVVVCHDRRTAAWAARGVDIGPPQWHSLTLRPLVLGPDDLPLITTPEQAAADIPLTVLSAILHHHDPGVRAILEAMAPTLRDLQKRDEDTADIYIELTAQGLGTTPAADLWRTLVAVDTSFFVSPLAEGIRDEGRAQAKAESILHLLAHQHIPLTDADRERVTSCTDLTVLDHWFDRALTATTAAEVFTEPEPEPQPGTEN